MTEQNRTNPVARVYVTREDGEYPMYADEWSEWAASNRTPEQYEDPRLKKFLTALKEKYLAGSYVYYEEAVPGILVNLSPDEMTDVVDTVNVHLKNSNCTACGIINEDAFAENNETGEEGPLVDYTLDADNLAGFLDKEGSAGLYEHFKIYLPLEEWQALTKEKEQRFFDRPK